MSTETTPAPPLRAFRILRTLRSLTEDRDVVRYYKTKEARDAGARRWAIKDGAPVLTELWDAEIVANCGVANNGWGCDGKIEADGHDHEARQCSCPEFEEDEHGYVHNCCNHCGTDITDMGGYWHHADNVA